MQAQKLKSILSFLIIAGSLFYASVTFARVPDINMGEEESRSYMFLELVASLETINLDLDFIDTSSQNLFIARYPVTRQQRPTFVGRQNPFVGHGKSPIITTPAPASSVSNTPERTESAVLSEEESVPEEDESSEDLFDEGVGDGGVLQFDN